MTPAENKQTVEALADAVMLAFDNALDAATSNFATRVQARKDFATALRDLVAQADRAAELEAALREIKEEWNDLVSSLIAVLGHLDKPYPDDDRWTPWTRFVERPMHHLDEAIRASLAGDGGGA